MLVDEAPPLDSAFSVIFNANSNNENKTISEEDGISTGFKDLLQQNEFSLTCLNSIQAQIDNIKARRLHASAGNKEVEMIYEDISQESDSALITAQESLDRLVKNTTCHSLENDLKKILNR